MKSIIGLGWLRSGHLKVGRVPSRPHQDCSNATLVGSDSPLI
jgi:hypothetical protein